MTTTTAPVASFRLPWDYCTEERPDPSVPTAAEPGSAGKVEVMVARRLAGQTLFHKNDEGAEPADLTTAFAAMMREFFVHGVYRLPKGRWRAYPYHRVTKKRVHLGYYQEEHEAIAAVMNWERTLGTIC